MVEGKEGVKKRIESLTVRFGKLSKFAQVVLKKDTKSLNYKYITLTDLIKFLHDHATKTSIWFRQFTRVDEINVNEILVTEFFDVKTEQVIVKSESIIPSPEEKDITKFSYNQDGKVVDEKRRISDPQARGSILTYVRRYQLLLALGVFPEEKEDNDAGFHHMGSK